LLSKINPEKKLSSIEPGSLVSTTTGDYFISVGIGLVNIEGKMFYCISIQSPIGNQLKNKKGGDKIEFNGTVIIVEEIN